MTYRIRKEFHFSASHLLAHLGPDHPCARLRGHNYVVAELSAEALTGDGFARDYRDLGALKDYLDGTFDHRHLNDVMEGPTTAVAVSETPKTWAEYRP